MKILIISPVLAPPVNRGNKARIFTLANHLIQMGHEVHFFAFPYLPFDETEFVISKRFWRERFHSPEKKFVYHFGSRSLWTRFKQKIAYLTGFNRLFGKRRTEFIDQRVDFRIRKYLKTLQKEEQFDAVMVNYVYFSRYLRSFSTQKVLKVLDTHDVFTNRHEQYQKHNLENHMVSLRERSERRGVRRAHTVIAIQDEEQAYLQKLTKKPVVTVGHILKLHRPIDDEGGHCSMLFVGAQNQINELAVKTFIEKVLPRVREALPKAELWVAGHICSLIDEQPGVALLHEIHDLKAVYQAATVVVNPCPFGTGLKIKTIEALSYSKPLVTTNAGAAGLASGAGSVFLVADQPEHFAHTLIELLKDKEKRKELRRAAFNFMTQYNDRQLANLKEVFVKLPEKKKK